MRRGMSCVRPTTRRLKAAVKVKPEEKQRKYLGRKPEFENLLTTGAEGKIIRCITGMRNDCYCNLQSVACLACKKSHQGRCVTHHGSIDCRIWACYPILDPAPPQAASL